ncbi:MAG TPA: FAD-dependent monooxygenase, partial [Pirellulales bacterium]|nr:FAD-dependent monooxygenase [Pirellulales bacterium]
MKTDYHAIIVGAGPAGSTAAILLASAGWSVALIEKQTFPRRKVCGACIGASNLPLLTALGIGGTFHKLAGPELRKVAVYCGDRVVAAPLPAVPNARHPWGRALGRESFDT